MGMTENVVVENEKGTVTNVVVQNSTPAFSASLLGLVGLGNCSTLVGPSIKNAMQFKVPEFAIS